MAREDHEIIWKRLLAAQAHDSYGGCNSDETNASILQRVNDSIQQDEGLVTLAIKEILNKTGVEQNTVFVYNQKNAAKKQYVKLFFEHHV